MSAITLDSVAKRFPDGTEALKPTELTIEDGELFVLVGPSGCGKSTLLKLIVGLERPSSGEVRVGGETVTGRDPKDRNMAMVFQSYALYPHMSVRDNLAFPLKLAKVDRAEADRRVERAAELLELGELLHRKPAALSGGQRQRVAMGRAIVREPAAFLLDEPLSNLDAKLRVQMRNQLAALQRRLGTTTVYVTHDQTEAMTLGHRIAVLRNGEIQQVGSPQDLYRRPANLFVAGFIGAPAMNLLPARIDGGQLRLPMTSLPMPEGLRDALPAGAEAVIAGIRPEHFRVAGGSAQSTEAGAFRVRPDLVEWLGADVFVHFDVAAQDNSAQAIAGARTTNEDGDTDGDTRLRVTARVASDTDVQAGAEITLAVDADQLLLFDPDSGLRLGPEDG
ncbi:MAG: sn-glycerol-3-phosphate ABC transporter ATP-binding protein UgpC [Gammaproteobacteria bacterium]|jgi:multiple sugar transport system ATP-binding protein|nr:sn-glycerol-3-phosphate ABC transporter ATP-binding protein UgpC [Gammaproteobacteria bacterium]